MKNLKTELIDAINLITTNINNDNICFSIKPFFNTYDYYKIAIRVKDYQTEDTISICMVTLEPTHFMYLKTTEELLAAHRTTHSKYVAGLFLYMFKYMLEQLESKE